MNVNLGLTTALLMQYVLTPLAASTVYVFLGSLAMASLAMVSAHCACVCQCVCVCVCVCGDGDTCDDQRMHTLVYVCIVVGKRKKSARYSSIVTCIGF